MRLKIAMSRDPRHAEAVIGVGWINNDETVSCGDDRKLLRWNLLNAEAHMMTQLSGNFYPTSLNWFPRNQSKQPSDIFVITSTEGKFYLFNRSGKIEKSVEAHRGAALCARWSGEDGSVKMWSKNGMLRSVLSQNGTPVYCISWSGDSSHILYCCGQNCFIKVLKVQMSPIKWKAHDGVVLCVDWSCNSNLIITGGEDCKYKVWDNYGRPIFSSSSHCYPITSISWNVEGDLFIVGAYNMLRLCDKVGWSHSLENLNTGSILNISWSPDSTQFVGACANGHVVHCQIIERRVSWHNIEAIQSKRKIIDVRDVTSELGREKLEIKDRITKLALGFDHLVVTTTKQCYIFSIKNWNTPIITNLKECAVSLILPNVSKGDILYEKTVAVSNDTTAIRDRFDPKTIHIFETATARTAGDGKIVHSNDIVEIAIDQCGSADERKLAFIDTSCDCYIISVRSYSAKNRIAKLGTMITKICFNDTSNILAGLQDNQLIIWTYPGVVFVDRDLLPKIIINKECRDFGRSQQIISFIGNHISIRRSDGCLVPCGIPPFAVILISYIHSLKWDQAITLCRKMKEEHLWAILAAMAVDLNNFYAAEIAYAALDEVEKVNYLSSFRTLTSKEAKLAMMHGFKGNISKAESMFIQSGDFFKAIMLNISMFRWQRALELAIKYNMHLDTVIGYRQKFLQEFGRKETDKTFLQHLSEVEIDWECIQEKIRNEEQKTN
ncbi:unnamed protein product [Dracunculus medinensis]|uniref:WD_REPEATS_REGION domain-containing protein n=1 Tax=Dracunculus medinensis TaxID=318479 RepID=A0A0N4UQZ4_DRAME|nr:unnamed protein product [Dracunculus medinensis]